MANTITLTATARYGYGGKQYIALLTGRDPKFTFKREFVGRKEGKRRETATYTTDQPGLYMTCDLDSKGRKDETYWLLEKVGRNLEDHTCSLEKAMEIASWLDKDISFEEAVAVVYPRPVTANSEPLVGDPNNNLKGFTTDELKQELERRLAVGANTTI